MLIAASSPALADRILYGNNAFYSSPIITAVNKNTGAVLTTYDNLSSDTGSGVAVVGTTMYYTAGSNSVYSYNLATRTDNGALFKVAGAKRLGPIAYDGTNLWIGDDSSTGIGFGGTNLAFLYTLTGTLLKTVSLSDCTGFCSGLEYFVMDDKGYLIANEGPDISGNYDLYDTNGNLVKADYLNASAHSSHIAGIAFDGTDFYTSNPYGAPDGTLSVWTESGTFVKDITLQLNFGPSLDEDLSFDYSQVLPPPSVPEPGTLGLFGTGLVGFAGLMRRRLVH
jgi:hypothetical protein